jgi:hypothetical protein
MSVRESVAFQGTAFDAKPEGEYSSLGHPATSTCSNSFAISPPWIITDDDNLTIATTTISTTSEDDEDENDDNDVTATNKNANNVLAFVRNQDEVQTTITFANLLYRDVGMIQDKYVTKLDNSLFTSRYDVHAVDTTALSTDVTIMYGNDLHQAAVQAYVIEWLSFTIATSTSATAGSIAVVLNLVETIRCHFLRPLMMMIMISTPVRKPILRWLPIPSSTFERECRGHKVPRVCLHSSA